MTQRTLGIGRRRISGILWALFLCGALPLYAQVGHILEGSGPINHSMAGAATGNPVDPCGALFWNPAGLTRFHRNIVCLGSEAFKSHLRLGSAVAGTGAWGAWNRDPSHMPLAAIPTIGMFLNPDDSKWSFAVGLNSVAGFGVNFDPRIPNTGNPILYPQNAGGFGGINSEYSLAQLVFGGGRKISDKLSLGVGVLLNYARLEVDPFPGAAPTAAGYPNVDQAGALGYGFNFGILYDINEAWSVGAAYRTMVNFKTFDFSAENAPGFSFDMDLPSILSVGIGYNGLDRWKFTFDIRKINYDRTDGFAGDAQFGANGAVKAFGWDSIYVFALGAQYQVTEKLTVRCGAAYNTSPIRDSATFFNVASPAIIQYHASLGLSYRLNDHLLLNLAYVHGFRNSIEGPMYQPNNQPVPGSRVRSDMSTDSVIFGLGWFF